MFDFHCHTTLSDGVSQPEALIKAALDYGLKALAITDHDNTHSYQYAEAALNQLTQDTGKTLELIPGIEINTHWNNHEVHVLGFYINRDDAGLQKLIKGHQELRVVQMQGFVDNLKEKANIEISIDDIRSRSHDCGHGSLGRPHVAHALIAKGAVSNIGEAFQKYLTSKTPTYVNRETARPHEAVEAIYDSGGIPVIAHPGDMPEIKNLVVELMDYGLRGLEAYHRSHSPAMIDFHCTLAERYGLIVTGGTDYHGPAENYANSLSRLRIPPKVYDRLKEEHASRAKVGFKVSSGR
jgi:3',5'-nucleoside bisphosphate phosphatase